MLACTLTQAHTLRSEFVDDVTAYRGHADDIVDVAWAPDGSGVVSASIENTVILWDTAKGKRKVRTAFGHLWSTPQPSSASLACHGA